MNSPSIAIKIKGASALQALGLDAPCLGGLKVKAAVVGVAPAASAALKAGCPAVKVVATTTAPIPGAASALVNSTKGLSVLTKGALASASAPITPGTIWTGTGLSLGLGLGLGSFGPLILLGTAGVVGAGLYLYRASLQAAAEHDDCIEESFDED